MSLHAHYPSLEDGEQKQHLLTLLSERVLLASGEDPPTRETQVLIEGRPTREQLEALPELRDLVIPWSGLPVKARELLADFPHLRLFNIHHNAAPVAEHAMALLLAAARSIVPCDRALRQGDWRPRYEDLNDPLLEGGNALILGAGAVGRRIARAVEGLGMNLRLFGRRARAGVEGIESLPNWLPTARALMLALPLTTETRGLIAADELSRLPRGAILVNVGRAQLVEEAALFDALRVGHLRAGLDVWYRYPREEEERERTAPSEFDFSILNGVVHSPHRAGHGQETARLRAMALSKLLNQLAQGVEPETRVLLDRGY